MTGIKREREMAIARLRADAEAAGVDWDGLLQDACPSKASLSRMRNGTAGLPTIARVRDLLTINQKEDRLPQPCSPEPDGELAAMTAIVALDPDSRARVIAWAKSRWP